jgi:putative sterol carrier protein
MSETGYTLADITGRLGAALAGQPGLDRTVKLDLKGEGFIFIDGPAVTNEDRPADCTVVVRLDDLVALAKGKLDPAMAMMRGRLKIQGDASVAMKLQPILAKARG